MSKEFKDKAKEYLKAGLSVIPTKEDKLPALQAWKPYQSQRIKEEEVEDLFSGGSVKGLAIICGAISGNLEVIDVDTKYDTTGSLWDELKALIEDNLPELYKSLVIAQTKSGGYHIYYRCSSIAKNLKLSNRPTTELERAETYKTEIGKQATEEEATKRSVNDKIRVLVETRGEGGYVIAPPTTGYKYIQGEPISIPTITPEDRDILLNIAKSFNEIEEPKPKVNTPISTTYSSTGLSPFEDYNLRGDVVALLESKGWRVVSETGQRINLLRPGSTDSKTSGNYHTGLRVLRVFSSSTEFNPDKGYSPAQVFSLLECNEDSKLTYRRLLELGYGEPYKGAEITPTQLKTALIKVEVINSVNRETSVISTPGETLKIENIQTALGAEVVITSPGSEAQEEVLKAIDLIGIDKRIYVKENGHEIRAYRYKLQAILDKYFNLNKGELTDRQIDSLLDEVVISSTLLSPIDKDIFIKEFISLEGIKGLSISQEAITNTSNKIKATEDKEAQAKEFKELLTQATLLQAKGDIDKALELLDSKVKEVKLQDKATEFSSLLLPTSEAQVKKVEEATPTDLDTGYTIKGQEFLLPGKAITVFAGATGHGKTILSINTALNVAQRYPDKKFIFLTYEERDTAILQYFLNTYIDKDLNNSTYPKSNRRLIKEYFKTGSTLYINSQILEHFEEKKEEFFKTYIETGRILVKYVDYNSQELDLAIRYLHKKEPNIGGVFIDYFQLLNLPGGLKRAERINSRQEELKEICQSLKRVAIDTGLPICLGAQFNRDVTDLTKLHPTKVGEAGDIERIVNTLVGLWDISKNTVPKDTASGENKEIALRTKGATTGMYVELLKSRELQTGIYELLDYNGKTGKIKNSSSSGSSYFK